VVWNAAGGTMKSLPRGRVCDAATAMNRRGPTDPQNGDVVAVPCGLRPNIQSDLGRALLSR
jgi:hypothetical protein